jgi:Zn-finger nucleic acid-binding protein
MTEAGEPNAPVDSYRTDPRAACPRCDGRLEQGWHQDMAFSTCAACGGVFVPPETMNRVASSREAPTDLRAAIPDRPMVREKAVRYLRCPTCEKTMNRRVFARVSGIIVDVCREHGVWFDAGELPAVIEFVEKGGLDKARKRAEIEREEARQAAHVARALGSLPTSPPPSERRGASMGIGDVVDLVGAIMRELFE